MTKYVQDLRYWLYENMTKLLWTVLFLCGICIYVFQYQINVNPIILLAFLLLFLYSAYIVIFQHHHRKGTLTIIYLTMVYVYMSLVSPLRAIYECMLHNHPWFYYIVLELKKMIDGFSPLEIDKVSGSVLLSLTVLLFCREMFIWAETIPKEEYNCYRIYELRFHRWTIFSVLSIYCLFLAYWLRGYKTYLAPLALFTVAYVITQMVLLSFSDWTRTKITARASKYVLDGLPINIRSPKLRTSTLLEKSCIQIICRLGRAYEEDKSKAMTVKRGEFQEDLLRHVTAKLSGSYLYQNDDIIWCSVGMACVVYASRKQKPEDISDKYIEQINRLGKLSQEFQYDAMMGMFCGLLLNLNARLKKKPKEEWDPYKEVLGNMFNIIQGNKSALQKQNTSYIDVFPMIETKLPGSLFDGIEDKTFMLSARNKERFTQLIQDYIKERGM